MKLQIERDELLRGLGRLQAVAEKRSSMPILSSALLSASKEAGKLEVAATDLEVSVRSGHEASVKKDGGIAVSARKLYDIARELPSEPIVLETTQNSYLKIKCDRTNISLAGADAEEYPTLPGFEPQEPADVDSAKGVSIHAHILSQMIERTLYAASLDETRYNLNGVFLEVVQDTDRLRLVATDGHRLAMVERALGEDLSSLTSGVIIPRKGLAELKRLADEEDAHEIDLGFEGSSGLARKGDVQLGMRLVEGEFPAYQQVIPKNADVKLLLNAEPLRSALRRVALLSAERSRAVKLEFETNKLTISSSNPDVGEAREELDIDFSGEPLAIGFNAKYLTDSLTALDAKEVHLSLKDPNSPAELKPANDDESLAVVMPMRL